MAYIPREWSCGDKITADSLNNIEDGIQEALECCADKGYECTETSTTLLEENVVVDNTMGTFSYSEFINAPKIKVTVNGVEYECEGVGSDTEMIYGDEFFVDPPFCIKSYNAPPESYFNTSTDGTYTVKVEAVEESVTTSECFEQAVKSATKGALIINLHTETADNVNFLVTDKTINEIIEAYDAGRRILIKERGTNANSEAIFEVYYLIHGYDSEIGDVGVMKAVWFRNTSQPSTESPYWDADPPTVYTTTYGNDGVYGHPNFSPYLSRYYGRGLA